MLFECDSAHSDGEPSPGAKPAMAPFQIVHGGARHSRHDSDLQV